MSRYVTYLCDGGPHEPVVPHPDCPDSAHHTPSPQGYVAASEWAVEMAKTHRQKRCQACGYWVAWEVASDRGRPGHDTEVNR